MENYLYFANNGNNDAAKDSIMKPASQLFGIMALSNTTTDIVFLPKDGTETTGDKITLTHTAGKFKEIADEFASLLNSARVNTNNFTVVADLNANLPANEGAISATGLSGVSALTITTDD
tara:strand:+ start:702 stop:1061 length:360 start_codon:yes stop_codon:yes gene_type:complete